MYSPISLPASAYPTSPSSPPGSRRYIKDAADWDGYRLTQLTANGFTIEKRTSEQSSWLHATDGKRALGMAFLGDITGGVAVAVKKFWQKYPASLEIQGATTASGEIKVWFWSPQAPAMDLRHYDTIGHGLEMAYEDWKEGWDNAAGHRQHPRADALGAGQRPLQRPARRHGKDRRRACPAGGHARVLPRQSRLRFLEPAGPFHARQARARRPVG